MFRRSSQLVHAPRAAFYEQTARRMQPAVSLVDDQRRVMLPCFAAALPRPPPAHGTASSGLAAGFPLASQ